MFVVQKDSGVIPHVLTQILDSCVNGVTLSDPDIEDSPLVYSNKAFEDMTGYAHDEVVGRNCRFLQGADRDQPELERLRVAIRTKSPSRSPCAITERMESFFITGSSSNRFSITKET